MVSSRLERADLARVAGAWIAALSIAAGLALMGHAPASRAGSGPDAQSARPPLWRVDAPADSGAAKAGRLYLLGSIHVGPKGGWRLPAATLARFAAAEALVVEVDMRPGSPEEQDDALLHYGLLAPGDSVKNHISPALYAMLERRVALSKHSIANINPWKPWRAATILLAFEIERLGYTSQAGVDIGMLARASDGQRIIGLETMTEQLSLLGDMSPANQELMLRDVLLQAEDIEAYFDELVRAWRSGDAAALERVLFRELEATPELAPFYERVIFRRNETMCARLHELLKGGETLFGVIGAYHLVGTRGIPACLADRGYEITRLRDGTDTGKRAAPPR